MPAEAVDGPRPETELASTEAQVDTVAVEAGQLGVESDTRPLANTEQLLVETETWYGILPSAGVRFSF